MENNTNSDGSINYRGAFSLVTSLFFMWGFITVMNDVLINTFEGIFQISALKQSLVQFAFFGAYFVVSLIYFLISNISGNDPINKIGYKNGMSGSLFVCGIGCILFYPAAMANSYWFFLAALFVLASGVTLLQICANPYAALLGKPETASSRLNLAQGLNSLGTTVGPLVGAILIFQIFSDGNATAESVGKAYVVYGTLFILLAVLITVAKLPPFQNTEKMESGFAVLKHKHLVFGIVAIFCYVGAEVAIGSWMVKLLMLPEVVGMSKETANYFLPYYWGGLMIGRYLGTIALGKKSKVSKSLLMAMVSLGLFVFIYTVTGIKSENGAFTFELFDFGKIKYFLIFLVLNYVGFIIGGSSPTKSLSLFSAIIAILLLFVSFTGGWLAFWCVIGIGLFNSIMWSNIFTLAIKGLGKYTSQGSSLLVMAVVGGAVFSPLQSLIIDAGEVQLSFLVPVICYIYLIYYGLAWKKLKNAEA